MYQKLPLHDANDQRTDRDSHANTSKLSIRDSDGESTNCQWPGKNFWYYVGGLIVVSVLSVAFLIKVETATKAADCGASVAEARAKGCQFEPMQRAWVPQQCYFPDPADEYSPFSDRPWFLDAALKTRADLKALKLGDVPVAYVANFHQEHCTYNWRKLAIAVSRKARWIDERVGNVHHATHCALGLAEQTHNMSSCGAPKTGTFTRSNLNFLKCQLLN